MSTRSPLLFLTLLACIGGGDKGAGDTGPAPDGGGDGGGTHSGDGGGSADTGGDTGNSVLPPQPEPFTLHVTGGADLDLYFDTPTCSKPLGSHNFRAFWRDSTGSHVFVLVAELLGTYTDPGTYDTPTGHATVKLQEEAGSKGAQRYFSTQVDQGDSAEITIDYLDEEKQEVAWGSFSFNGLHGDSGPALTATPQPIPIWCEALN